MGDGTLHYVPDAELAASVKGQGSVPSWLALGEISRRQKVRASAPSPASPQGTVADEVMQSLGQAGMAPAPQVQSQSPAQSFPGGILGGAPQMPVIRRASGGLIDDDDEDYPSGGLIPVAPVSVPVTAPVMAAASSQYAGLQPLDSSRYQVKYEAPKTIDPAQAEATVRARFGSGVDYSPMLAEIQKLSSEQKNYSKKDAFRDIGAGLMASQSTNPLSAIGEAIQGATGNARAINQKNLDNRRSLLSDALKISQDQQQRQDRIVGHIDSYEQAQNALAQNESAQKGITDRLNATNSREIDIHNQSAEMQKQQATDKLAKEYADDPSFVEQKLVQAKSLLNDPATKSDPDKLRTAQAAVDSLTAAKQTAWDTKKKADDEAFDKQKRIMDEQSKNAIKLSNAREAADFSQKVKLYNLQKGDNAKAIAEGIISGDPYDPSIIGRTDLGAVNAYLAKKGFDIGKARQQWESSKTLMHTLNGSKLVSLKSQIDTTEQAIDNIGQLSNNLEKSIKGFRPSVTSLNRMIMNQALDGKLGPKVKSDAVLLNSQIADAVSDLAGVYQGGGSPTDAKLKQAQEQFNTAWDNGTLHDALNLARTNVGYRRKAIEMTAPALAMDQGKEPAPAASPASKAPAKGSMEDYRKKYNY